MILNLLMTISSVAALEIDEATLLNLAKKNTPVVQSLEIEPLSQKSQIGLLDLEFQTQLNTQYGYADSMEEALIQFSPTIGPSHQFTVGMARKLHSGVSVKAELFGTQISSPDGIIPKRSTQGGARVAAEMEVLSNWRGKYDKARRGSLNEALRKSQSMKDINYYQYQIDIRKLYFALVSNDHSQTITKDLRKSARKQLADIQNRRKAGIASDGDIARAKAQLEARETSLLLLEHQKQQLIYALNQLIPELSGKKLQIKPVNREKVYTESLQCISMIMDQAEYSPDWTSYIGILNTIDNKYKTDLKQIENIGANTLTLQVQGQTSAADNSFGGVVEDEFRQGMGASLQLNIPLGDTDAKTRELQKAVLAKSMSAESAQIRSNLLTKHQQFVDSLNLLIRGLRAAERSNILLNQSVRDIEQKYRQARVNFTQLILEQEAQFNSSLQTVDLRLLIIHALLDYMKVFDKSPCSINHNQSGVAA